MYLSIWYALVAVHSLCSARVLVKISDPAERKKPWSISDSQPITRDIQSAGYPLRSHIGMSYIYIYDHHWSSTFNPKRKLRAYLLDVFSKCLKPPFEFGDGSSHWVLGYQCHQTWHWNNLHLPSGNLLQFAMERSTIFNGKTHYKWPFSVAMLVYQFNSLLWKITIFNGKIHYFDWAIFNSKLLSYQRVYFMFLLIPPFYGIFRLVMFDYRRVTQFSGYYEFSRLEAILKAIQLHPELGRDQIFGPQRLELSCDTLASWGDPIFGSNWVLRLHISLHIFTQLRSTK